MSDKRVYFFGDGKAEGSAQMKALLGGKGANLAEMTSIGVPVPPGFTITTEVCREFYEHDRNHPAGLRQEVMEHLDRLQNLMGKKLGDAADPLLVSVRSGAAVSMPGMMDTVLNLGLNDGAVVGLAGVSGNERFAWDAYRRFIQMFSDVVMATGIKPYEDALSEAKTAKGVEEDTELEADDLKRLVERYKAIYRARTGGDFPQDPVEQMWAAIDAVFGSWNNEKAIKYRKINAIKGLHGTAVNIVSMVYGNLGDDSGTGVCFSRDPSTGENVFYGEYLINAQGEDVVAGIRTPLTLATLEERSPAIYAQLNDVRAKLEAHYSDMQDMEFTIQQGTLFLLQTRNGKRTGAAAVKVAHDMVTEGVIDKRTAVTRVTPDQLDQVFHPMIDPEAKKRFKAIAKGLNASPGAASGQIVFSADDAEEWAKRGKTVLLVRRETSPEDIGGMNAAEGILTSTGGMTSHAAVVARGMGKPCVAGCKAAVVTEGGLTIDGVTYREGDAITIDGSTGEVFADDLPLKQPTVTDEIEAFLRWTDDVRAGASRPGLTEQAFTIRANADTPHDATIARNYGAEGIGLCRTEHMFFEEDKLRIFREMIVATDKPAREKALAKLLPLQRTDFEGIFTAMDGYPVTVRLLDPPLHEFVPHEADQIRQLATTAGVPPTELETKIEALREMNPMLGHRGCRLGITYPEVYDMQVEAILSAAVAVAKRGVKVIPEIMIPLVGTFRELQTLRANAEAVAARVAAGSGVEYKIGTMIEIPRAALTADLIAPHADFFSFGTNDLTQMTFGYSRDDVGSFLPEYVESGILEEDPFAVLDQTGVGQLVELGTQRGRAVKSDLKVGICGEHGGEPTSVAFCFKTGLNYVSCSPFRVPIARLAAAQAVVTAA